MNPAAPEWLGARFALPTYVVEGEPFRPEMAVWVDGTSLKVVGWRLVRPDAPADELVALLEEAMARDGADRRPGRLRVADAVLGAALRSAVGREFEVAVADTPELEGVRDDLANQAREAHDDPPSYLEGGRIPAATVARWFRAAARLYRAAPWSLFAVEGIYLRAELPALDLHDVCLAVVDGDDRHGFGLFASARDYERWLTDRTPDAPGVPLFRVRFYERTELPTPLRHEVADHGWELAAKQAYPWIAVLDPDGVERPLVERDVLEATVLAETLAAFAAAHAGPGPAGDALDAAWETYSLSDLPCCPSVDVSGPHLASTAAARST